MMHDAKKSSLDHALADRGDAEGSLHTRFVSKLVCHGAPIDFRALCERAIPRDARYLILDLDRTIHLAHNIGELLGWEIIAYNSYGSERLGQLEGQRDINRVTLDHSHPLKTIKYLGVGVRWWAYPGLYYLLWGKIGQRLGWLRRITYRRFGHEPMPVIQRMPLITLLRLLADLPLDKLRELTRAIWRRCEPDQVITAEDLAWLRKRHPGIRIIISSASPQPVLEVAAEALGVDDVIFSKIEATEEFLSAPPLLRGPAPRRMAPLSSLKINSSHAKIRRLLSRYPDLLDEGVISVGITDTDHGEDHCWAQHFTHVIDVNSRAPFSPIVRAESPLQTIHSALVLTNSERRRRDEGQTRFLDSRRPPTAADREPHTFTDAMLSELLAPIKNQIEQALASREASRIDDAARAEIQTRRAEIHALLESTISEYNMAAQRSRPSRLNRIRSLMRAERALRRQLIRIQRPFTEVAFELDRALKRSRALIPG